jgi:Domain of unknown function (DUF1844)
MAGEEMEDKGFAVKDRRRFTEAGEAKEKAQPDEKAESAAEPRTPEGAKPEATGQQSSREAPLPVITFSTFIFSLNTSALVHLGDYPDPATGKNEVDLPLAKQTIDLMVLLEEKTRGNLTKDEESLLKHVLYDLRLRYVQKTR